jgi:hypothetical protein
LLKNKYELGWFSIGLGIAAIIGIRAVAGFGIVYGFLMLLDYIREERKS